MTLPELSAELLPCPNLWCNDSKPTIVSRKGESREYHNVFCDTCDIGPSPSFHSRSEAFAAWNTRTGQLVEREGVAGGEWSIHPMHERGYSNGASVSTWWTELRRDGRHVAHFPDHEDAEIVLAALTAIKGGEDAVG